MGHLDHINISLLEQLLFLCQNLLKKVLVDLAAWRKVVLYYRSVSVNDIITYNAYPYMHKNLP